APSAPGFAESGGRSISRPPPLSRPPPPVRPSSPSNRPSGGATLPFEEVPHVASKRGDAMVDPADPDVQTSAPAMGGSRPARPAPLPHAAFPPAPPPVSAEPAVSVDGSASDLAKRAPPLPPPRNASSATPVSGSAEPPPAHRPAAAP